MVTFSEARDALNRRMEAVFGKPFEALHPGVTPPKVYVGFPASEPPFYVAVDEIVDTARSSESASMGHARIDFTVHVWCCACHAKQRVAADTLLAYVDTVFKAVLADQRLDMTVDLSFPSIETAGTSADGSKRYLAAASVAVECSVFSQCPGELMEAVNAANRNK